MVDDRHPSPLPQRRGVGQRIRLAARLAITCGRHVGTAVGPACGAWRLPRDEHRARVASPARGVAPTACQKGREVTQSRSDATSRDAACRVRDGRASPCVAPRKRRELLAKVAASGRRFASSAVETFRASKPTNLHATSRKPDMKKRLSPSSSRSLSPRRSSPAPKTRRPVAARRPRREPPRRPRPRPWKFQARAPTSLPPLAGTRSRRHRGPSWRRSPTRMATCRA